MPPGNPPCPIDIVNAPPTCPPNYYPFLFLDGIGLDGGTCYWECISNIPPPVPPTNNCGCVIPSNTKIPSGCVQVQNDTNADAPVRIAKIAVWDWNFIFKKSNITYTDERGCWKLNRTYNECRMKVIFENKNLKVRSMKYWASLRVLRDRTRVFNNTPYNNINILFNSVIDRREWAASHTLNTDFLYREEAFDDNIAQPRTRLNYHIYPSNTPGSAPMLQGVGNPLGLPFVNQTLPDFLPTIGDLLPDITNNYGVSETALRFNSTGYHELAHASHYSQVGETYWTDFRNHVIENNGDGTFPLFNSPNPGVMALGEAIAEYFEARYGNFVGGEGNTWRSNFIPAGLLWDLEDGVSTTDLIRDPDNSKIVLASDNTEGFTPEMYFNVLFPGVRTIRSFRDNLSSAHLSDTPNTLNNYNNFVNAYDVFN
ncbi:MAG: hypothetical protein ACJA1A_000191 [Saprospiraceae bacterium]|jgi:hypothetical protein|tara:strand:+ start:5469 stop:6746 length:1278 start_codon:yes stop_codon:yes gene_type:complete